MKPISRNDDGRDNRVLSQFAAQKKKTVIALCLIGVMAFMWVRVLGKKTPQSAQAGLMPQAASSDGRLNSQLKITFIELPNVAGRNDVLTRDFFAAENWQNFISGGRGNTKKVGVISKDGSEEVVRRVVKKLKLEAIGLGENPQAFINDELLSVGDKLRIKDGVNTYECEVVGIQENSVVIKCGEVEIKLKLT